LATGTADCAALLIIPPRETNYQAGEVVQAMLLAPPLGAEAD